MRCGNVAALISPPRACDVRDVNISTCSSVSFRSGCRLPVHRALSSSHVLVCNLKGFPFSGSKAGEVIVSAIYYVEFVLSNAGIT